MVERASTLEVRTELETVRWPSRPTSRAHRLGRLLRRSERGTAVVEFAIVVAPLLVIVFGILDFGRALNYYNDMTQLAGQGARLAAVNQEPDCVGRTGCSYTAATRPPTANGNFQQDLAAMADSPELQGKVQVCVQTQNPTSSMSVGDTVSVTVRYRFNFLSFLVAKTGLTTITLSSTQTERSEIATPGYTSGTAAPSGTTGSVPGQCYPDPLP
jgi:Flp pilus assembly protein TadG